MPKSRFPPTEEEEPQLMHPIALGAPWF